MIVELRNLNWRVLALVAGLTLSVGLLATSLEAQPPAQPPTPAVGETEIDLESALLEGKVPVVAFLQFIQKSTGRLVTYPSTGPDAQFDPGLTIDVLSDVRPLTYPVVKALLEANGYELVNRTLEDDETVVIDVSHVASRARADAPRITEVIDSEDRGEFDTAKGDELATFVLQLEYADAQTVIQALRDLLNLGGNRASSAVQIVSVPNTQTLIIKAKKLILNHIRELIAYIDVDIRGPETMLRIVPVYEADAQDLVSIIQEVLDVPATGRARTGGAARQGGQPRGGAAARAAAATGDSYTRLIADVRTQKIIVDTTSEKDLELILNLVDELDAEVRNLRPSNHIYRVKFLKASDLQEDLQALLDGSRQTGGLTGRGAARGAANRGGAQGQAQGQQPTLPSRVIAHDETNSLIIQAEYEEYLEVLNILESIDIKRRQVFLEAALVQVNESSTLNYTLEYLAGNLDDEATRVAAMTSFGLSTLDPTGLPGNFDRVINPDGPLTGLLAAVSRDGRLPVLLRAIKSDTDSKIIASPFILADDNQTNTISVETEIFFETTTLNNNFSQGGQSSENAGVTLSLLPTISQSVVLLELNVEFSAFASASSSTGTLPDRNINSIESRVTIPDGRLFIIGGLARESESLAVDKVPILGDIPLIGRFFQSRSSDARRDNLYVFLNAHILSGDDFSELGDLTDQGLDQMETYSENYRVKTFRDPKRRENTVQPENPEDLGVPKDGEKND